MAMVGDLERRVVFRRAAEGTIDFTGATDRRFLKVIAGLVSFAGSLAQRVYFKRSVAGTLVSSGDIGRKATLRRSVAGVLDLAGSVASVMGTLEGVLSFAGALSRRVFFKRTVAGSFDTAGSSSMTASYRKRAVAGILSFVGGASRLAAAYTKKGLSRFGFNFKED